MKRKISFHGSTLSCAIPNPPRSQVLQHICLLAVIPCTGQDCIKYICRKCNRYYIKKQLQKMSQVVQ
uniref:Uncharacterized protein n=1 Tax=Populus trichocarpa TaxID=3694 RepID=U5G092_POPTR